jgi:hypothetical protein
MKYFMTTWNGVFLSDDGGRHKVSDNLRKKIKEMEVSQHSKYFNEFCG